MKFIACTLSMDILGFKKEELIDGLEFAGVAAYLGEASARAMHVHGPEDLTLKTLRVVS